MNRNECSDVRKLLGTRVKMKREHIYEPSEIKDKETILACHDH